MAAGKHLVSVKLKVRFESIDSSIFHFGRGWSFAVGRYRFEKNDNDQVDVSFSYEDELEVIEGGVSVGLIPSRETEKYRIYEKELEMLLDMLTIQVGRGLKVIEGTHEFRASIGGSSTGKSVVLVNLVDLDGLRKRWEGVKSGGKKLRKAMRSYRNSLLFGDVGFRIDRLWAALETLKSEPGGKLLTKVELDQLSMELSKVGWSDKKIGVIIKRLEDSHVKSVMESLVENVKISSYDGDLSDDVKRKVMRDWRSVRSKFSHGSEVVLTEQNDDVLWDMESVVKSLLFSEVTPKLIGYFVFTVSEKTKDFCERNKRLVSIYDGNVCAYPIGQHEKEYFLDMMPRKMLSHDEKMWFVDHKQIVVLTCDGKRSVIGARDLPSQTLVVVEKCTKKINS